MTLPALPPELSDDGVALILNRWEEATLAAVADPDYRRWGYFLDFPSRAQLDTWISLRGDKVRCGGAAYFAVVAPTSKLLVGAIDLDLVDPLRRWAEVGYWTDPAVRGRGIATNALRLLSTWADEAAEIRQIDLPIHPDNTASKRVALKAGYISRGLAQIDHPVGGDRRVELFTRARA